MNTKNMNYMYNVEYFQGEDLSEGQVGKIKFQGKNKAITNFLFPNSQELASWKTITNYKSISLRTAYPGLLIGLGNLHEVSNAEALKCGFTFDYVSGLPYITGSTLKGLLRSYFPNEENNKELYEEHKEFIAGVMGMDVSYIEPLRESIFEHKDIVLGAYPVIKNNQALMGLEYITPHKPFKNPIPIQLLKVKPNVTFEFGFILRDSIIKHENGEEITVTIDQKLELFKTLLLYMGIGAKTNVGFGKFVEMESDIQ